MKKATVLDAIRGMYVLPHYPEYMETREYCMGVLAMKWAVIEKISAMEEEDERFNQQTGGN